MEIIPKKESWQDKVKKVFAYHMSKVKEDKRWTIKDTAKTLDRSIGAVSQDINLYYYLRTYTQLEEVDTYVAAVEWMRQKKLTIRSRH